MKSYELKQKISKIYHLTTKITIYAAVLITIVSLMLDIYDIKLSVITKLEWIILSMLIATPFLGIIVAIFYYYTHKNTRIFLSALGIIIFILAVLIKGYIS
ncbi:hypothetical protein [Calditerrivibrio nitroreducens]|uniref:Uncharacterized protein n=1 Tax=Calditerrivibrio nitroreducens (strain DSM 19672 / NBRC 101217 / Yu37-1) TaxID=768670 RepID=E4TFW9_CALNY|nr:hypothetical protein [Calditerrivibrio nitroreducens]ADR19625.1 hypothetical protein Calni_1719 [Calditerrivibrio nitroreducens DSM 19672]